MQKAVAHSVLLGLPVIEHGRYYLVPSLKKYSTTSLKPANLQVDGT